MQATIFDTALGMFGLGWTEKGVARAFLPGLTRDSLEARLEGVAEPGEPGGEIAEVREMVRAYAEGERVDFAAVRLDLDGVPEFHRRAYALLVQIGWGETTTYGALARGLGDVSLSRAVGQAMGANRIPLIIPCHRVLASDGRPGGFSAPGGAESKIKMLSLEGVTVGAPPGQYVFEF